MVAFFKLTLFCLVLVPIGLQAEMEPPLALRKSKEVKNMLQNYIDYLDSLDRFERERLLGLLKRKSEQQREEKFMREAILEHKRFREKSEPADNDSTPDYKKYMQEKALVAEKLKRDQIEFRKERAIDLEEWTQSRILAWELQEARERVPPQARTVYGKQSAAAGAASSPGRPQPTNNFDGNNNSNIPSFDPNEFPAPNPGDPFFDPELGPPPLDPIFDDSTLPPPIFEDPDF